MYNSYEEYMRNMLGYSIPNTYMEPESYYYDKTRINQNIQEINSYYPEIYGIVYPVIQKICSRNKYLNINKEQIDQMVEEAYNVIEPKETQEDEQKLRNGDVRNPRAREEIRKTPTTNNYLLKDLIRILIIRELLSERPGIGNTGMFPGNMQSPRRNEPNASNIATTECIKNYRAGVAKHK